jgi:NADPH:quinone reductase-like Zn-dependent oxidoreductase
MRAVVHDRYGPPEVLRVEEVARPVPEDDEVLVKVHATTVARMGCSFHRDKPFVFYRFLTGLRRPRRRILGSELAGEVEAVGAAVSVFAVGDRVFGSSGLGFGAHAELITTTVTFPRSGSSVQ